MTPKTKKTVGIVALAAGAYYLWTRRSAAPRVATVIAPKNVAIKPAATTPSGAAAVGAGVASAGTLSGTTLSGHVLQHYGNGSLGR